jgi:hypothetical protein
MVIETNSSVSVNPDRRFKGSKAYLDQASERFEHADILV